MKKNVCLIVVLIFLSSMIHAQRYVSVLSSSGLNLRAQPSPTATVKYLLNFGDSLLLIDNTKIECPPVVVFKKTEIKDSTEYLQNIVENDLSLTGQWLMVKYKNDTGFVNSAFVSKIMPNLKFLLLNRENETNSTDTLAEPYFYLLNKLHSIPCNSKELSLKNLNYTTKIVDNDSKEINFEKKYKSGITYHFMSSYLVDESAGGYTITISHPALSFNEAIMLCRSLFFWDEEISNHTTPKIGFKINEEDKKFHLERSEEGGGCSGDVYQNEKGEWVIEWGCGGC